MVTISLLPLSKLSRAASAALLAVFVAGCGVGFDSPSEVRSLRVLGVQKSQPYPLPGETVDLNLFWHDPFAKEDDTEVSRVWFRQAEDSPSCVNPPGDLYYACFADPSRFASASLSEGDHFSFQVPTDIASSRGAPAPGQPRYGLIFAFFAICKGRIGFDLASQEGALPLVCRDDAGNIVGPERFVAGYVSLYVFPDPDDQTKGTRNANPAISGFEVAGKPQSACIGTGPAGSDPPACVIENEADGQTPLEETIDCDLPSNADRCFDACPDDGDSECPDIKIRPLIDAAVAERDEVSIRYYGRDVGEQMWINYYVDRGSTKSPVRLLNDAVSGWNADYGTEFWAPKDPGPVTIWAVVHDNRGGMNWVRTQVGIR